jgi:hypothetical protein
MKNYSYTEYEKKIIQTLNKFDLNYILNNYKLSIDFCKNYALNDYYQITNKEKEIDISYIILKQPHIKLEELI